MPDIIMPQFMMDSLANTILFVVGHLHVRFGTLNAWVRDDFWHLWVREGRQCLGHDGRLTAIYVGSPKLRLHILHHNGKLVQGSWPKVEDATFQVTVLTLEVGIGFGIWTSGFGPSLLTSVLLGLGCLPLFSISLVLRLIYFKWTGWFSFNHPLHFYLIFLTLMLSSRIVCHKLYRLIKMGNPSKPSSW